MNPNHPLPPGNDPDPLDQRQADPITDQGRDNEDLNPAEAPLPVDRPGESEEDELEGEPSGETVDEEAMDQADEAGSALLEHDKVLKQRQ